MDRDTLVVIRRVVSLLALLGVIVLLSCASQVEQGELVGTWTAADGGIVRLEADRGARVEGIPAWLPAPTGSSHATEPRFNATGDWELTSRHGEWDVSVGLPPSESSPHGQGITFTVQGGPGRRSLVIWQGEQFDSPRYELRLIEKAVSRNAL